MLVDNLNIKDIFDREIILVSVPTLDKFNFKELPLLSKYFTLFIANNKELIVDQYFIKANELITSGLAYLCVWGNECEKIHDIFDEEIVSIEIDQPIDSDDDNVIMTTWHNKDSLKDALWYFLNSTSTTDKYYAECKSALVLVIGNSVETDKLKSYLENQDVLEE